SWKSDRGDAILNRLDDAGLIGLTIADFSMAGEGECGWRSDPGQLGGCERAAVEGWGVFPLGDDDDVAGGIFADDKPRFAWAPNGEATPLADGVVSDAIVATNHFAFGGFKITRRIGDVAAQKFFKIALANETDAGAVFFFSS